MGLLIAVKSCHKDRRMGCHDIIRATWGQNLGPNVILKFFMGQNPEVREATPLRSDELVVDCADDYNSLPHKTRAICQWVLGKNVSNVFLCDTDTYVKVNKLLTCGYGRYDYVGKIDKEPGQTFPYTAIGRAGVSTFIPECYPWASGGLGYFLSRDAAQEVADMFPIGWAEDLWVGQVLGPEIAKGHLSCLSIPRNTYSLHHPQHGEIYTMEVMADWMNKMHMESK